MTAPGRRVLLPPTLQDRAPPRGAVVHDFAGRTMGTTWHVLVCAAPRADADALRAGIQAELDDVVAQMSTWEATSDLTRYNRAPAGAWQSLPASFCEVLACALAVAEASGGAFDPSVGPLVDVWGFGPPGPQGVPADAVRADALASVGWRRIEFDLAGRRLRQPGGVHLDFSAIAKGHGVDRVARWLDRAGCSSHLVEVGGELRGSGMKPDGQPWWVVLEQPDAGTEAADSGEVLVALNGLAVATSGDYRRWFAHGDTRYSHTVDPRRGAPVTHGLASVSVLHADCMAADAWSTALTVLGADDGLALADRLGLAARFVSRADDGWHERWSAAGAALLA